MWNECLCGSLSILCIALLWDWNGHWTFPVPWPLLSSYLSGLVVFGNKEFIIWATVSSWSPFWWLYRASLSSAAKNIINPIFTIDHLVMSMCRVVSFVVVRGLLLWPAHSLCRTLLSLALLHFVLQGQTCLSHQVSLNFLLLHSSSLRWKGHLFGVSSKKSCRSS